MFTDSTKLKVIIADSSNFSRLVLSNMVQAQPDLEVLDTASDGLALVKAVRNHRPDVVLADLDLQQQSQLVYLQRIYQESGVPVLMMLDQEHKYDENFLQQAQMGVYDCILKPAHRLQPRLRDLQVEILKKIRAVRQTRFVPTFSASNPIVFSFQNTDSMKQPKGIIVIGASTGGTQAIEKIVENLDEKLDACILIAVHLPAGFTASFARRLQAFTKLKVLEGKLGTKLLKGKIIIAPGGKNMVVMPEMKQSGFMKIGFSPEKENEYDRPSVDKLMESVARVAGKNVLGVVLTGMGKDGTKGLSVIQNNGGTTLAQDQSSSVIFGMAKSAIEKGYVTYVRSLNRIPGFINQFITELPAVEPLRQPGF